MQAPHAKLAASSLDPATFKRRALVWRRCRIGTVGVLLLGILMVISGRGGVRSIGFLLFVGGLVGTLLASSQVSRYDL